MIRDAARSRLPSPNCSWLLPGGHWAATPAVSFFISSLKDLSMYYTSVAKMTFMMLVVEAQQQQPRHCHFWADGARACIIFSHAVLGGGVSSSGIHPCNEDLFPLSYLIITCLVDAPPAPAASMSDEESQAGGVGGRRSIRYRRWAQRQRRCVVVAANSNSSVQPAHSPANYSYSPATQCY